MTTKRMARGVLAILALALWFGAAGSAYAQNSFYREVAKDGRLYVFAVMKEFATWQSSGETGKAITRLGYGAGGETVIFDSEDAINLYNFKHGLPGEVFAQPKHAEKPADSFSIGVGTTIFSDFTYTDTPQIKDADGNTVSKSEFEVRRAYVNVTGKINDFIAFRVTPDISSRFATTGATANYDGSLVFRLKYAFAQFNLDKVVSHGSWVRFGQQQTPYVDFWEGIYRYRFQGTTFVEREGYLSSSDVGLSARLALNGDYGDVHVGVYNGDTYSKAEANDQKAVQIRATLRPAPKSNDLKGLRLTAFYDLDHPVKDADRKRFIGNVSFEHKYLNLGFEFIDAKDSSSATKPVVSSNGWSIFATPKFPNGLEALLRYDAAKPNKSVDATKKRVLAGLAYWFKAQKSGLTTAILADYEQVKYDAALNKPDEKRYELKTLLNF